MSMSQAALKSQKNLITVMRTLKCKMNKMKETNKGDKNRTLKRPIKNLQTFKVKIDRPV